MAKTKSDWMDAGPIWLVRWYGDTDGDDKDHTTAVLCETPEEACEAIRSIDDCAVFTWLRKPQTLIKCNNNTKIEEK